jgi:hypothetical protein
MHARTVSIKDASYLDADTILPVIIEEKGLCAALALIIARADSYRVDVSPVVFLLRVD